MNSAHIQNEKCNGPLSGYRVLELGSTAAGPFCTRLLADFGAEVIKLEAVEGDPIRQLGEVINGKSLYASTIARNKEIISLNLKSPKARDLLISLIPKFDIVVENFRPGVLEKWGLGYRELIVHRPDLIMTSISGFGQTGPYRHKPGYGVIGEAMSGLRHMIGDADRPPSRVAVPLTDYIAGLYAALGTVMAVLVREKTGEGQCVDATLIESAFSFMEAYVPAYEKTGRGGMRSGPRLPNSAPNTLFPTRDGQHIHIAALADSVFRRLAIVMERADLCTDERFSTQAARNANEAQIESLISNWSQCFNLIELQAKLDAADVPASRIYTMEDIYRDEYFRAREMLVEVPDDDLGHVTLAGVVPKMSKTPGSIRWAGHRIGQDTRRVLAQLGGLSTSQIDELEADGAISCDPQASAAGHTA